MTYHITLIFKASKPFKFLDISCLETEDDYGEVSFISQQGEVVRIKYEDLKEIRLEFEK
jgi:hypothetical protein